MCGFPTCICLIYKNDYEGIRGHGGFRIGVTVVNNLRYADDTVIVAESEEQLQRLINVVVAKSEEKRLHTSEQCEFLLSGVFQIDNYSYMPHRRPWELSGTVLSFGYLDSLFPSDEKKEIRRRIVIAKSSFTSMNKIFTSRNIDMAVRLRLLKYYIWSTLLYGCET